MSFKQTPRVVDDQTKNDNDQPFYRAPRFAPVYLRSMVYAGGFQNENELNGSVCEVS